MAHSLILFASSRRQGNTRIIAEALKQQTGADLLIINDLDIGYYDYQHRNREDDFLKAFEQVLEYDTLLFVTPVYWYSMCAQMKTFIDRMSDLITIRKEMGKKMRGKRLAAVCCSSDAQTYPGFFMPFEQTAGYFDMEYLGHCHTWIEDDRPAKAVQEKLKQLAQLVRA